MAVKDYVLEKRKYVIGAIALIIVLLYTFRLYDLQILSDNYKNSADSNAFLKKTQYPARGSIYDRNGNLLVFNQPAYDISIIPREIANLDTLDLCNTLRITPEYFVKRMADMRDRRLNPGYSRYTHQVFMTQLSAEEIGIFQEKLFKYPGFYINRRTVRQYSFNSAAHMLGDIGEVSKKEIEADEYYVSGDYIGKLGLERSYEKFLRGEKGVEVLLRDAHGRIQGRYMDGAEDIKPVAGKNLITGLDIELQLLAEKLLQNKLGSVVAIEPSTGEILCMVSAPSYDPSIMVGRQRGANHLELSKDPKKPLFNRALMSATPPGSTFKTAQGLIFLQEDIIDVNTTFPCHNGFVYPGARRVGCHPHGSPIPFIPSLSTSCNAYYCWGFLRMINNKTKYGTPDKALNKWRDYMVNMGFGYPLGVDIPGEKRGLIPNGNYYDDIYKGRWNAFTIMSLAIGQGEVLLTPIQIANLAATIGNRGHFITPHLVKEVENDTLASVYTTKRYTGVDTQYYDYVVEGMRGAVIGSPYGSTCRGANIPGIEVCGKTGTAQNRGKDHSIFMGFAPMENPKIAICVYIENGGFGATWAVPTGALLIEQYLNGSIAPERAAKIDYISNANLIPYEYQKQ
ncbi:penicillin-binding protein 2 [Bacteroides sp. 214]|uniref:penicillin-binding transpeptidase domain-containing protein n=1 Tax=Bacteroides sp. 214 TaxID=2302935 RepID=UPI0013D59115|nr:penicillin-binding transpeptidase domain-containing protein [Bacteroides sp. 214]NDW13840.1 penicillin-binding protein 2 [Bacteroides sp. 214]